MHNPTRAFNHHHKAIHDFRLNYILDSLDHHLNTNPVIIVGLPRRTLLLPIAPKVMPASPSRGPLEFFFSSVAIATPRCSFPSSSFLNMFKAPSLLRMTKTLQRVRLQGVGPIGSLNTGQS
ncbi:hypothetical protein VNO77_08629 [Canavalia gladiata]|uniref:Uncharacterized protein n=1 Tax=Canavalia gladiata TaxID=3824 RepID=A0AAN9MF94_CANGL